MSCPIPNTGLFFFRWRPPSTVWVGSFIFSSASSRDACVIPFLNWGYVLHVEHISCVIANCGQHQWAIPSTLNGSFALAGGNYYKRIIISIFDIFFKCSIGLLSLYSVLSCYCSLLFSCDQAALWMVFSVRLSVCPSVRLSVCPSVRLSVCLSVCHTFLTMFPSSYHHEIFRSYHIGPG